MLKRAHAGVPSDPLNTTGGELAVIVNVALESGVSTLQQLAQLKEALRDEGLAISHGLGDIYPILTDQEYRILLGVNMVTGEVVGKGLGGSAITSFSDAKVYSHTDHEVIALITDAAGNVLVGYDVVNRTAIMHGIEIPTIPEPYVPEPVYTIVETVPNLSHVLAYGGGTVAGTPGEDVVSIIQPYDNLTFTDGVTGSVGPLTALVETTNETLCSGLANYATLQGLKSGLLSTDHVILASAVSDPTATLTELSKDSTVYTNLISQVQAAHDIDASHVADLVSFIPNESDVDVYSDALAYRDELIKLVDDLDHDFKVVTNQTQSVDMLVNQLTQGIKTSSAVVQGTFLSDKLHPSIHLGTPVYHMPYVLDGSGLTSAGHKLLGVYNGRAYRELKDHGRVNALRPLYVEQTADSVIVHFDVPTLPLNFTNLPDVIDKGFAVYSNGVLDTLTSVTIVVNKVVLAYTPTPGATVEVQYGLDNIVDGLTVPMGASGSLSDSTDDKVTISGSEYTLFHACPHFKLTAHSLEI